MTTFPNEKEIRKNTEAIKALAAEMQLLSAKIDRYLKENEQSLGRKPVIAPKYGPISSEGTGHGISVCRYDLHSNGECQNCSELGGCLAAGGPFLAGVSYTDME